MSGRCRRVRSGDKFTRSVSPNGPCCLYGPQCFVCWPCLLLFIPSFVEVLWSSFLFFLISRPLSLVRPLPLFKAFNLGEQKGSPYIAY